MGRFTAIIVSLTLLAACGKESTPKQKPGSNDPNNVTGSNNNGATNNGTTNNGQTTNPNNTSSCEPQLCSDDDVCTRDRAMFDAATCQTLCSFVPLEACTSGDGCCPSGCAAADDDDCECDPTTCPDGEVCLDTGVCGDPTECSELDCGAQVCDPVTVSCVDACTANSCEANETCNPQTGACEVSNCPGEDPNQCDGDAQQPLWDPVTCRCVECVSNSQCDQAAGETCNDAGECFACQTVCDANTPGTCQGSTPYCINDCCVECVGGADCPDGQLCLDGFCGESPNCLVDPTVCPSGYDCDQQSGSCQPVGVGQACDPNDPNSCPQGTFCDPATQQCSGSGGGVGCGLCNADCTCPSPFQCNGLYCASQDPNACLQCPDPVTCASTGSLGEYICLPN